MVQVTQLWRFPVKSLGGERVESAEIDERGIVGDRRRAILDVTTGAVLTARRCPDLLFASARTTDDGVVVERDDGVRLQGDEALSDWLGRPVRLIEARPGVASTYETVVDFEHEATSEWVSWEGPEGTFHDSKRTRVSIMSLDAIDRWDVRRFRANVVVDTGGEDLVGCRVAIGSVELDVVKRIDRCVVTTRPQPGLARDLEVLRTINRERNSFLGVGAMIGSAGRLAVGDAVTKTTFRR